MLTEKSFPGSRAFARWMLRDVHRLISQIDPSRTRIFKDIATEVILFRESCWQVELITVYPNAVVAQHRHMHVESTELPLGGGVIIGDIDGEKLKPFHRETLFANLIRIPAGVWHGGRAGQNGVVWLSFQKWIVLPPTWITDDWEE